MKRKLRIWSYFSVRTDLAAEMRDWSEFVTGKDYDVDLRSPTTDEVVSVRFVDKDQESEVLITGTGSGLLFDRAAGHAIHALAAHSDYLMIRREDES
jgi:hypothetical protein